jgi:hypothetical protein
MIVAQFFLLIQILKFCTLAILFSIPHLRKEEEKEIATAKPCRVKGSHNEQYTKF